MWLTLAIFPVPCGTPGLSQDGPEDPQALPGVAWEAPEHHWDSLANPQHHLVGWSVIELVVC